MTKVTINVTENQLNNFESFLDCTPFCPAHKHLLAFNESDDTIMENLWRVCPKCDAVRQKWLCGAHSILSKLIEAVNEVKR
jgi:hypothetical protein